MSDVPSFVFRVCHSNPRPVRLGRTCRNLSNTANDLFAMVSNMAAGRGEGLLCIVLVDVIISKSIQSITDAAYFMDARHALFGLLNIGIAVFA